MATAIEEFFPECEITNEGNELTTPTLSASDRPNLHRVDTSVSSIVGPNNGDRPGGFVLVIDGMALTTVLFCSPPRIVLAGLTVNLGVQR
jgi:phospholipid-translocating ATPase